MAYYSGYNRYSFSVSTPKRLNEIPLLYKVSSNVKISNDANSEQMTAFIEDDEIPLQLKRTNGRYELFFDDLRAGLLLECSCFLDEWRRRGDPYIVEVNSVGVNNDRIVDISVTLAFYGLQMFSNIPFNVKHRQRKNDPLNDFLLMGAESQTGPENPVIRGKTFCFTGNLFSLPRLAAVQLVTAQGGICKLDVSRKVDYLVAGELSPHTAHGEKSQKQQKAELQQSKGDNIQIISEEAFLDMLILDRGIADDPVPFVPQLPKIIEEPKGIGYPRSHAAKYDRPNKGQSLLEFPCEYVVFDLETTGLSPRVDEIIEIAAIRVIDGMIVDRFETLVEPLAPIRPFIEELTGITNEMVAGAPTIHEVLPKFLDFIGDSVVVAHNANFDVNFLYDVCIREGFPCFMNDFVDTLRLSRLQYPNEAHNRLCDLTERFQLVQRVEHRAMEDVLTTNDCIAYLKKGAIVNE